MINIEYEGVKISDSKITITQNAIHTTQYARKYLYSYKQTKATRKLKATKERSGDPFMPIYRARKKIRLLTEANTEYKDYDTNSSVRPLFVTLTFGKNITSIKDANKRFNLFIKRLNYKLYNLKLQPELTRQKYIVVPEIQVKRAKRYGFKVWHYHIIFFKFPKLTDTHKFIMDIWGEGFIFNNTIKNVDHLQNYIAKYISKDIENREKNQKRYFTSRGLKKPQYSLDMKENNNIIEILEQTTKPTYQIEYGEGEDHIIHKVYNHNPLIPLLLADYDYQIRKEPSAEYQGFLFTQKVQKGLTYAQAKKIVML